MQAIRPKEPGGPEVMQLAPHPTPSPGPGQLLVRTSAIGVNFIDVYQRRGLYKIELPMALGLEGAGTVEAVGPPRAGTPGPTAVGAPDGLGVGALVAWASAPGSYATHVLVEAARAVPVPQGVGARAAAALMLQGMTAHYLATDTFALGPGHTALIHAASGGVGLLLIQLAKRAGARVLGTVSNEDKAALAREAGADEVILYETEDFEAETRRLTGGRGVDVVYDGVGVATFLKSLRTLRPRGTLALFGQSSGPVAPVDPQLLAAHGSLFLTRPTMGHYTADRAELLGRARALFDLVAAGALRVRIGATFPLAEAGAAHQALEARRTSGKVLLLPDD
jgi:NADPH2:quinone reductase